MRQGNSVFNAIYYAYQITIISLTNFHAFILITNTDKN